MFTFTFARAYIYPHICICAHSLVERPWAGKAYSERSFDLICTASPTNFFFIPVLEGMKKRLVANLAHIRLVVFSKCFVTHTWIFRHGSIRHVDRDKRAYMLIYTHVYIAYIYTCIYAFAHISIYMHACTYTESPLIWSELNSTTSPLSSTSRGTNRPS